MPTKLTNLRLHKIDRVPAGAQPDAHITLVKSRAVKAVDGPVHTDTLMASRPHPFQPTPGNPSVCATCGGAMTAPLHKSIRARKANTNTGTGNDGGGNGNDTGHSAVDSTGDGMCDVCGVPMTDHATMSKSFGQPMFIELSADEFELVAKAGYSVVVQKWTDTPDNRRALAAMSPPQALPDGSYPMPNSDYVSRAINALGRAGDNRGRVISLIRRRAKELGMDLSGSSVPELATVKALTKGEGMPTNLDGVDLSALDDDARAAIDALVKERDDAIAKATEPPAPTGDDDDDLTTVDGIQKAIAKTKSEDVKRILKASLARVVDLEKQAGEDRARAERLEKAERTRTFKAKATELKHVVPMAKTDTVDGVDAVAALLDEIDAAGGPELSAKVGALLGKSNVALSEFLTVDKALGERGHSMAIPHSDDNPLEKAITKARSDDPTLDRPHAVTKVLDANPALAEYAL